jgi:flagellar FliL protein
MAQASPRSTSAKSVTTEVETTETPAGKPKKKMLIIAGVVLVLLIAGGSAAAYFFMHKPGNNPTVAKKEDLAPPVFLPLDNFTVNLSPDEGDKYLQVTLTLQVPDEKDADTIKAHMPQVRDRILLLLSNQKASDLLTEAGKNQLTREIISTINKPFDPAGDPQKVSGVFFTSFIIQ